MGTRPQHPLELLKILMLIDHIEVSVDELATRLPPAVRLAEASTGVREVSVDIDGGVVSIGVAGQSGNCYAIHAELSAKSSQSFGVVTLTDADQACAASLAAAHATYDSWDPAAAHRAGSADTVGDS